MEFININLLYVPKNRKLTLNQISKKERELTELNFENIPPILINELEIIDGVKRFLVLKKLGYESVPVKRIKNEGKVSFRFLENYNIINYKIAA